jgi:hemolysin activation/secretion protein
MGRKMGLLGMLLVSHSWAQIDDRGYSADSGDALSDFSFQQEAYLTSEASIPPRAQRDEGPSIEVSEFQFVQIPEFPELGITRQAVQQLAETLRRQYSQKPEQLPSGYTRQELLELGALLPAASDDETAQPYSLAELEQIADYIQSFSDSDAMGGIRQYEVLGLESLLASQLQARGEVRSEQARPDISSLQLDNLIRLFKQQRAERGINFYELEDIAGKLTAFYRNKGVFLAKVYVPVQDVEQGIVSFDILEGVLGSVAVKGNKGIAGQALTDPFDDYVGQAVRSDEIEEALYLINDIPGLLVQGALTAGSRIGETIMELNVVEEKSWRATVTADNHGSVFTGDNRLLTMVDWFNPGGFGDVLTIGYLQSWSPLNSDVAVIQYRAPVLDERTHAYFSADVNEFMVDGNGDQNIDALNIEGTNTNYTLGMDRQFKRLPGFSLSAGFALSEKETEIEAIIQLPNTGEKVQGLEFNLSFNNIIKNWQLMNIVMASVQYGEFKSGADLDLGQDEEFYKLAVDWSALKLLNLPFSSFQSYLLAKTKWRYSESVLPAFEQLPLGGADAVRAFTVSDFSADQAVYLGAEWYVDVPVSLIVDGRQDKFKVALFVDGAYGVSNVAVSGQSDGWANLAGAGLLFKYSWREMVSTKISFSKPLASKSNQLGVGDDADSIQTYIEFSFVYD